MKTSIMSKVILGLVLIATGYFGAQLLRTSLEAREEVSRDVFESRRAVEQAEQNSAIAIAAEAQKARFEGVVDGIFIAPKEVGVPEEYVTYEDLCGSLYTENIPWDRAGELNTTLALPKGYGLNRGEVGSGVIACGERVLSANWIYNGPSPFRGTASSYVHISRSVGVPTHEQVDVAVDRPKTIEIGGRTAVVIEPLTEDGYGHAGYAWFQEPFGVTRVYTMDLSRKNFLALVEAVASSTR